jgi:putative colanic acid biosynthesis acetyltransferase WcaF
MNTSTYSSSGSTDLSSYNNSWYNPGNALVRLVWYFVNVLFFINPLCASSFVKVVLLKVFGAKVGKKVIIKPGVNIKYPWLLTIGDHSWIGENVWIDNLDKVTIGKHCCLSQGALLLCGNHNYKKSTFDLMIGSITLEDGVWLGAQSIVTGNTVCKSHAVLSVQSTASGNLDPYSIYKGNPAIKIKDRIIK